MSEQAPWMNPNVSSPIVRRESEEWEPYEDDTDVDLAPEGESWGETLWVRQVAGKEYAGVWRMRKEPRSEWVTIEMNITEHVLEGTIEYEFEDRPGLVLSAGDTAFLPAGTRLKTQLTVPFKTFYVMRAPESG